MRGTVECLDAVKYYVEYVNKRGIYLPMPRISFELRGTVAGRAFYKENKVVFNPILLDENPEDFVKRTVGHEVAHLAAFTKHGGFIKAHGVEWKQVMLLMGLPPVRCHNYDTSTVRGVRGKSLCNEIL